MKVDGKKLAPAGALGVSLLIHVGLLILIGSVVLIEQVIPKTAFKSGDATYDEAVPNTEEPAMEEPQADTLSSDSILNQPAAQESDSASMPDLISSEVSNPTQSFTMSAPVTAVALGTATSPGGAKGKGNGSPKLFAPKGKASDINFFGIKGSAKRVAFLLDASGSMVTVDHGGREGYAKLKADLVRMIQALDPNTSFSVFIFDSTVDQFRTTDVEATEENKKAFATWLDPYMSKQFGNLLKNYKTDHLKDYRGTTRMDLALTGAFESGCDSIFILTDGTPSVQRPLTEKEENEYQKLHERNLKEIEAYSAIQQEYNEKYKDLIAEMRVELNKRNTALDGRQKEIEYWIEGYKGLPPRPSTVKAPPGTWRPVPHVTGDELIEYLQQLYAEIYKPISQEKPAIHIVGYGVNDADRDFLKKMSRQFSGNYSDFKFGK